MHIVSNIGLNYEIQEVLTFFLLLIFNTNKFSEGNFSIIDCTLIDVFSNFFVKYINYQDKHDDTSYSPT